MNQNFECIIRNINLDITSKENITQEIIDSIVDASNINNQLLNDKDILCIPASIISDLEHNYISYDDIAKEINLLYGEKSEIIILINEYSDIYSFIIKGISRSTSKLYIITNDNNINIDKYCECDYELMTISDIDNALSKCSSFLFIQHDNKEIEHIIARHLKINPNANIIKIFSLNDICKLPAENHGYNPIYGIIGSDIVSNEELRLLPKDISFIKKLCHEIQEYFKIYYNVNINVFIYNNSRYNDIWKINNQIIDKFRCTFEDKQLIWISE